MQAIQAAGAGPGGPGPGPGGPGPSGPGAGAPPAIQVGPQGGPTGGGDGDPEDDLKDALDALQKFMQDEDDHQEKAVIATCIANIQKLLGSRQAGAESALGVTPAHKAMSRAGY